MVTFGNSCISNGSTGYNGSTVFDTNNPSSSAGTLTQVCVYCQNLTGTPIGKVKVFRLNGSNYDFIGESGSQGLVNGTNTFSSLSIVIATGDYIGVYLTTTNGGLAFDLVASAKSHTGDITTNTPTSEWNNDTTLISVLATYTLTGGDIYVTLTGNDSNSGGTLASSKLTLYGGINILAVGGNLHIGFGDFSAQTSFRINKTMNWVFDTSGGIGTITFPPTA